MVKTSILTLRRQWTDKLQRRHLKEAVPTGVQISTTREEVVLESSKPSDLCEAESRIRQLVVEKLVGLDRTVQSESNGLEKVNDDVEMDQEMMDKQQQQKDASVEEKTSSEENEENGHTRPEAKEERRRKGNDRKDTRRIAKKQQHRTGSQSEQHRDLALGSRHQKRRTSSENYEPDSDDSRDKTTSVKSEPVTVADAAQESYRVTPGMQNKESGESHHTAPIKEQFLGNVSETSVSLKDEVSAASDERQEKYLIDEPLWAYIQFIDPQSQWDRKFAVFDQKQGDEMVQLSGSSADVDSLKTFCNGSRLKRAVKRKIQCVPEGCIVSDFLDELRKLSSGKVLVRQNDDFQHKYCELIGKKLEVDELQDIVDIYYPGLSDAKNTDKHEQPKGRTELASTVSQARTDMSSVYHSYAQVARTNPNSEDGFQFCTLTSKLTVKVITGDLLKQRCEILVNPSNSYLGHKAGLSRLLVEAAGYEMERECLQHLYKHRMLQTSQVLDTTAGKMRSPVRRIFHACGPNMHGTSDRNSCGELLEQTFFNCFALANDKHDARSIAVPAISSGLSDLELELRLDAEKRKSDF